jgi:predicted nucleic acid-binding protein
VAVLFLDANVLFSAAYRSDAGLLRLWDLPDVKLITSDYAAQEARRNLAASDQRERLESLIARVRLITAIPEVDLPESLELPDKDQPILLSAIGAHATHLLTADYAHFGKLYGSTIGGVLVLPPSEFLRNSMHAGR